jgi:hypothetical protein
MDDMDILNIKKQIIVYHTNIVIEDLLYFLFHIVSINFTDVRNIDLLVYERGSMGRFRSSFWERKIKDTYALELLERLLSQPN